MLDRDKVIMMTRMSSYEKGKGKEHLRIGSFFRSDYIWASIIKAVFSITVAFIFGLALYIYYNFEEFMSNIYEIDIISILYEQETKKETEVLSDLPEVINMS